MRYLMRYLDGLPFFRLGIKVMPILFILNPDWFYKWRIYTIINPFGLNNIMDKNCNKDSCNLYKIMVVYYIIHFYKFYIIPILYNYN